MQIRDLLSPERVVWNIQATSKKRAIEILSELLARDAGPQDAASIFSAMLHRERLGSTAVGHGTALPHGRVAGLQHPLGSMIRLVEPVEYDAADGIPVDIIFALIVPEDASEEDLQSLKALAREIKNPDLQAALRRAHSSSEAFHLITQPASIRRASA